MSSPSSDGSTSTPATSFKLSDKDDGVERDLPEDALSETASSYKAPLGDSFSEISLDQRSVVSLDSDSNRPEKLEDLSEEDKNDALRVKKEANKSFMASDYQSAMDLYTLSLGRNPFDSAVWCNRAACRLKREEFGLAISDATEAIQLDPKYVKAYYRRAVAALAIMNPKSAVEDFKKVAQLDPKNMTAKAQLDSTVKLQRRLAFEKAISAKEEEAVSSKIKKQIDDGMEVEKDYDGPILQEIKSSDGKSRPKITQEFIDGMIEHFKKGKLLPRKYVWQITLGCQAELLKHKSLVEIDIPQGHTCDVIGDTHGQFYDLLHLLSLTGRPSPTHTIVANGDFVDRGSWSTEVVLTFFAYKWLFPKFTFLNRGNHETSDMNKVYGFEGETKKKYSELTYRLFEEVFCALPLATLVSSTQAPQPSAMKSLFSLRREVPAPVLGPNGTKRYLVLHGGIFSKDEFGLNDIRKLDRLKTKQPNGDTPMGEMLWADPQEANGRGPSKRGVGLAFGPDVTRRFAEKNGVTAIIRSHEVRQEGYSIEHDGLCHTVFSAPNYVDQVGNLAAFLRISDDGSLDYTTYSAQPHPTDIRPMMYAGGYSSMMM